jgi:hypothetical protein
MFHFPLDGKYLVRVAFQLFSSRFRPSAQILRRPSTLGPAFNGTYVLSGRQTEFAANWKRSVLDTTGKDGHRRVHQRRLIDGQSDAADAVVGTIEVEITPDRKRRLACGDVARRPRSVIRRRSTLNV